MVREGDLIFLKIKFFRGLRSRLPPRSVLDGAHWAPGPPCTPKGVLSSGSPFYFVFLGIGTCLPLLGGPAEPGREGFPSGRFPPPAPSRKRNEWERVDFLYGRGRIFYISHFKGGCCPLCIPHGGEVSPAGSVGVGKAPLALNASPAPPPTRRMSLSCREFRERETRPSKLHKVQLDSFAHPPRTCLTQARCLNL